MMRLERFLVISVQELRYQTKWEAARDSQHALILEMAEDRFSRVITVYTDYKEQEHRVHAEIARFIQENSDDLTSDIEYWMQHYDEEIERRDNEISLKKCQWEDLNNAHVKLQDLYAEHMQFIVDRKAELKERKRLAKLFKKQTKAAIKIQAWWRGWLVRKKIGPYKWLKKFYRLRKIELAERAAAGLIALKGKK